MVNTGALAVAHVRTSGGTVEYEGDERIGGVPGSAAPIAVDFPDIAGSSCGAFLPTGAACDEVDGIEVTCIDNGMPVVILRAADVDKSGDETPAALEADEPLKARIERIRLAMGPRMNLGNVAKKTVPKMCLVSPPRTGGSIATRTFIPHRVHESIGVLGAVSIASACVVPGSVPAGMARIERAGGSVRVEIEHPTGSFGVLIEVEGQGATTRVVRAALLRTARKLMSGHVFIPSRIWSGS
jgi:4-oxalomesaconate tautomerase